jgi:hypothetical protein
VCTNDIILTGLLPSIIHRGEYRLAELLGNLRKNRLQIEWPEIQDIQVLNLKYGNNNVGISDIIIAQNCMQNDSILITSILRLWQNIYRSNYV